MMQFLHYMQGQVEQSPATGQECYTVCSQDGQERKVMEQKFLIILMGMKQESNLLLWRSREWTLMDIYDLKKVFTVLSEFLHSMQQENDRHRLHPVM